MAEQTMRDAQWGPSHRSLNIQKIENGYTVSAVFLVEEQDGYSATAKLVNRPKSRTFCYYTTEELLGFVENYLDAPADDLRELKGGE